VSSSAQIPNIDMIGARQLGEVHAAVSVDQPNFVKPSCAVAQIGLLWQKNISVFAEYSSPDGVSHSSWTTRQSDRQRRIGAQDVKEKNLHI